MNRYGQLITWSALSAPHLFTGQCSSYEYRDSVTQQLIEDQVGDNMALVLHSHKADVSFEAMVTSGSTDFLDLSSGGAIAVSGISTGVVLVTKAIERWTLQQKKTASISATHYPDIVQASPVLAGTALTAFTPDQSALTIVSPGATIIYGTYGLSHASGIVHGLTIEQSLTISEDEPSPAGTILGAASHGYMRKINLELLGKTDLAAAPAVRSTLVITNAPSHAGNYKIEKVATKFADKRGKMYSIDAVWIPPFT